MYCSLYSLLATRYFRVLDMNGSANNAFPDINGEKKAEIFHIALLAAYAVGLYSIETLIPRPIPWLRFGFSSIITLTTLLLYGLKAGVTVMLVRVFVGSLFAGTFLGPAFALSLGAGVSSTLVMWYTKVLCKRLFSPIGISIMGALTHNIVQLLLAYLFFVRRFEAIVLISPVIILFGALTGAFNGIVTSLIIKKVQGPADRKDSRGILSSESSG
ncbi:heptaprenyl diphosphate synthase component I [bacterium BMS3Abin10]|nr:heptaprenyl diphosphate synthase component I [bacterium BMS3Abin10]GBE37935.1 heptaprenyl diphosphate synthase component I [bacterium BMS3Bbin08]HDK17308.1 Gx transporter family protein [Nitrospirota bacterium]